MLGLVALRIWVDIEWLQATREMLGEDMHQVEQYTGLVHNECLGVLVAAELTSSPGCVLVFDNLGPCTLGRYSCSGMKWTVCVVAMAELLASPDLALCSPSSAVRLSSFSLVLAQVWVLKKMEVAVLLWEVDQNCHLRP